MKSFANNSNKENFEHYRDDGLIYLKNCIGLKVDCAKKKLTEMFKNHHLNLDVENSFSK